MAIAIVSDVHGAADELRKAVPEGTQLLLLGDLINFLDYSTMDGILTEVFSVEAVQAVVDLRTAGRIKEAGEAMRARVRGREDEIRAMISERVHAQYESVFDALVDPTYVILGNVDQPHVVDAIVRDRAGVHDVDGRTVDIEGERFGFVGGALPTPLRVAGEITEEQMRTKIEALGDVEVLCSHIPPAVPELCYDTVARKSEKGSEDLLEYIRDVQPSRHYFGHVHQPLVSSLHVGTTLCVNVGYFRATRRAFPHRRD